MFFCRGSASSHIYDSLSYEIEEKLWAKIPNYYVGKSGEQS